MDFQQVMDDIRKGAVELAANTVGDFANHARDDMEAFLQASRQDLERWTLALTEGRLTAEDFGFLVKMRADLLEMRALTAVGVAATRIEHFRRGLISLVVRSALAAIPSDRTTPPIS